MYTQFWWRLEERSWFVQICSVGMGQLCRLWSVKSSVTNSVKLFRDQPPTNVQAPLLCFLEALSLPILLFLFLLIADCNGSWPLFWDETDRGENSHWNRTERAKRDQMEHWQTAALTWVRLLSWPNKSLEPALSSGQVKDVEILLRSLASNVRMHIVCCCQILEHPGGQHWIFSVRDDLYPHFSYKDPFSPTN